MIRDSQNRQRFFIELARSILYWLNYNNDISREDIFKEDIIRIPLSEYIERRLLGNIETESQLDEDNTNKHFDFKYRVRYNNRVVKGNVEVKYVQALTRRTPEHQRYFDDICRLALKNENGSDNILIVFGPKNLFNSNLVRLVDGRKKINTYDSTNKEIKPEGIYSEWLHFTVNDPNTIKISDYQDYYEKFANRHEGKRLTKIKTELLTLQEDKNNYNTYMVGIWKITNTR